MMQNNIIWILIAIPVVMYILSSLFKGGQEDTPKIRPEAATRSRPPSSDIDRFLEEINRRRREAAERQGQPPEFIPETVSRPPPPPMPVPPRSVPMPFPRPAGPSARRVPPVLDVVIAEEVRPAMTARSKRVSRTQVEPVLEATPALLIHKTPPPPPPAPTRPGTASPAAAQLVSLLGSPQTLRSAILLQEILGPPRCRRSR